jgi:hypothetical protein
MGITKSYFKVYYQGAFRYRYKSIAQMGITKSNFKVHYQGAFQNKEETPQTQQTPASY